MSQALRSSTATQARHDRLVVLGTAGAVVALSWAFLLLSHVPGPVAPGLMTGPHVHPPGGSGLAVAFLMWTVMMVAMMLPAVMPWILLFSRLSRSQTGATPHLSTASFVGGYLAVWSAYAAAGAVGQIGLQGLGWLHHAELRVGSLAGGLVLVVAGVFQLTPWKASCLRHCRSPLGFFLSRWRDGPGGAFGMGFRHGLYCAGCCWALMAVGFALGVMNLLWMGALTVLLCVEKIAPGGAFLGRLAGLALAVWGVALLL